MTGDHDAPNGATKARKFDVVAQDYRPNGAVLPGSDQLINMIAWRRKAISSIPSRSSKLLAAAWVLQGLAAKSGFATISNRGLAQEIDSAPNKVDDIFRDLEELDLLQRTHVSLGNGGFERRIWLILPDKQEGSQERESTPRKAFGSFQTRRNPTTLEEARRDAERRQGKGAAQDLLDEIRGAN